MPVYFNITGRNPIQGLPANILKSQKQVSLSLKNSKNPGSKSMKQFLLLHKTHQSMNKTININLGGYAFVIDEDAFDTANHYLHTLAGHFSGSEGSDEIMQD